MGEEESIYIRFKNGKKIGIHSKAYENFAHIKRDINRLGLHHLNDYDYKKTYLKYFKVALPLAFLISLILFLISKFI